MPGIMQTIFPAANDDVFDVSVRHSVLQAGELLKAAF
jgi:hypothetical protein